MARFIGRLPLAATLRRRAYFNGLLPEGLPFWAPKKEAKKVPATSDSAGGPAQGARPLGTPKRRSKKQKAKTCRSAARFLTLFASSPFDPSGAKISSTTHSVGADACIGPHWADANLRVGRRGGFYIRPKYTRIDGASRTPPPTCNHTVAVGACIARPLNLALPLNCTGEHCSPLHAHLKAPL